MLPAAIAIGLIAATQEKLTRKANIIT